MTEDTLLIKEFKRGNLKAFEKLVVRHQKAIYFLALRFLEDEMEAEDMVQKTFIQAFKNGHKFKEKSEFKTWIFRIALNLCKNQLRRLKRGTDPELEKIDIENKILDNLISKEKAKELYKALNKLPDKQRFTIILRIYHELSYQDIAKIMECPLGTAKANFHHGVLTLKRQFKSGE